MKVCIFTLLVFVAVPFSGFAQKKEYVQLQRDVSILQDQLRTLQRSMDEKTAQLTLLVQQALDSANKTNTSVTALDGDLRNRLQEQEKNVGRPVTVIGSKVDQLSGELQAIKESLADLSVRFGKLEQQMVDTANAVKTIQAPPPPPGAPGAVGGAVSSKASFDTAVRDKTSGSFDLALKEFQEYLQSFGDTELAPDAQYYIGEIHYNRGEMADAVKAFDMVLEKYPENAKTPDAHLMKGKALVKMHQLNKGRDEFYALIKRFPDTAQAAQAKDMLKGLGLPVTQAPALKKRRK